MRNYLWNMSFISHRSVWWPRLGMPFFLGMVFLFTGCAGPGFPWRGEKRVPGESVPVELAMADSLSTAESDTLAAVFETLDPPDTRPVLPVGPTGYTPLEDLEALSQECLQLLSQREPALALDHLYVLNEELSRPLPSVVDSLYEAHHRSLQRRVWFMQAVESWVNYYTGNGRRQFQRWLNRKARCEDLLVGILREYGLPEELIFVSVIESGIGSHAVSSVGAVGPWQFMPETGKRYHLRQSWWLDERRDLEMSTRAAARHLAYLHDMFGDWALALAAYNSGEGRVAHRIRIHGHDNFWDMRLPSQTTAYVPKFIAAARIGRDPEKYGFKVPEVEPLRYDVVRVRDATESKVPLDKRLTWRRHKVRRGETLGQIARLYGSSVGDIAQLNKMKDVHLIRPGDQLLIPMPAQLAAAARKRASESGHYIPPAGYKRVTYKVKKGDTLGGIGRKLGVSVRHLRKVNGLSKKSNLIYPGQKLHAYRP